jgi:hypothetical protein
MDSDFCRHMHPTINLGTLCALARALTMRQAAALLLLLLALAHATAATAPAPVTAAGLRGNVFAAGLRGNVFARALETRWWHGVRGRVAAHGDFVRGVGATAVWPLARAMFNAVPFLPIRVAREFAGRVNEQFLGPQLQDMNQALQEDDSPAPHPSLRNRMWVEFMMTFGISSEEELELAKIIHAYSQRTCAFCGSNSAPLRNCSLCMELRYCIGTDCQHAHWNKPPAAESHKVLCPRIFVRGSKGRIRRA